MHVENNFLVDVFFQVNSFSKMTFHTSLRKFQYFLLYCRWRLYVFQAIVSGKLKFSNPKTQDETE